MGRSRRKPGSEIPHADSARLYWSPERLQILRDTIKDAGGLDAPSILDAVCAAFPDRSRGNCYRAIWAYAVEIVGPPVPTPPKSETRARIFSLEPDMFMSRLATLLTPHGDQLETPTDSKKPAQELQSLDVGVRLTDVRQQPGDLRRLRIW